MRIDDAIQQGTFENEYHRLAVNLIYTSHHFAVHLEQALQPHEVSPEQFNVLRILRGKHPAPMAGKDIQARMLNPMSNTSRLVEKLRSKGLVERSPCHHDRRAVDISLTSAGIAKLEPLNCLVAELHRDYRTLDEDEAAHLNDLLDRLRG